MAWPTVLTWRWIQCPPSNRLLPLGMSCSRESMKSRDGLSSALLQQGLVLQLNRLPEVEVRTPASWLRTGQSYKGRQVGRDGHPQAPQSPSSLIGDHMEGLQGFSQLLMGNWRGGKGPAFSQPELGSAPATRTDCGGAAWGKVGSPALHTALNSDGQTLSQLRHKSQGPVTPFGRSSQVMWQQLFLLWENR